MTLVGRLILAVFVLVGLGIAGLTDNMYVRAAALTYALMCTIIAVWLRAPEPEPTGEQWTPAPPDLNALGRLSADLCPVPAAAPPPVDRLLASVNVRAETPMVEMVDGEHVPTVELDPTSRLLTVERGLVGFSEALDVWGERLAQTLSVSLTDQRSQIEALGQRTEAVARAAADDVAVLKARLDGLEGRRLVDETEAWLNQRNDEGERP